MQHGLIAIDVAAGTAAEGKHGRARPGQGIIQAPFPLRPAPMANIEAPIGPLVQIGLGGLEHEGLLGRRRRRRQASLADGLAQGTAFKDIELIEVGAVDA